MTTLTEEYFDEAIADMKKEIKEEVQGLATMVANGFSDLEKRLDVRERVDVLEKKVTKVESALDVRLWIGRNSLESPAGQLARGVFLTFNCKPSPHLLMKVIIP